LAVVPMTLPPLRERPEEILPLAQHFLRAGLSLDAGAERVLAAHAWPGNVRELQNVIQRASLLCEGSTVTAPQLAEWLTTDAAAAERTFVLPAQEQDPIATLVGSPLATIEDRLIRATLSHFGGNRSKTAEVLGIGVRTLFNKLRVPEGQPIP
jgi:DNA-binding NtrC family response regulator